MSNSHQHPMQISPPSDVDIPRSQTKISQIPIRIRPDFRRLQRLPNAEDLRAAPPPPLRCLRPSHGSGRSLDVGEENAGSMAFKNLAAKKRQNVGY